ncbi:hypothetical protein ACJ73_03001 [Blastomyces percursus]|uniref:Uncharacterized protein n=1 Tax=Blastomyces percursus TaxID=1658174 RepID=A0A1J9RD86_9EURO|nr:hypothetical protein ACJ73_03001 [Blastomyces percursus]
MSSSVDFGSSSSSEVDDGFVPIATGLSVDEDQEMTDVPSPSLSPSPVVLLPCASCAYDMFSSASALREEFCSFEDSDVCARCFDRRNECRYLEKLVVDMLSLRTEFRASSDPRRQTVWLERLTAMTNVYRGKESNFMKKEKKLASSPVKGPRGKRVRHDPSSETNVAVTGELERFEYLENCLDTLSRRCASFEREIVALRSKIGALEDRVDEGLSLVRYLPATLKEAGGDQAARLERRMDRFEEMMSDTACWVRPAPEALPSAVEALPAPATPSRTVEPPLPVRSGVARSGRSHSSRGKDAGSPLRGGASRVVRSRVLGRGRH